MIWFPIFITGLSDVIGSWNTIDMRAPQNRRISFGPSAPISSPSNLIEPLRPTPRFGSSPMIERDSTVLPDPDSPTMPRVRPRSSVNDTPSTAWTVPRSVLNVVETSSTASSGTDALSGAGAAAGMVSVTGHLPGRRSAPRIASPSMFSASTVKKIISAGSNTMCGATER